MGLGALRWVRWCGGWPCEVLCGRAFIPSPATVP